MTNGTDRHLKPFSLRLTEKQCDTLAFLSRTTGIKQNELVRRLLDLGAEAWIEKHGPPVNKRLRHAGAVLLDRPDWLD